MLLSKIKTVSLIILVLLISFSSIGSVVGAGLLATPPNFKYNLTSSQTVTGEVTVQNIGDVPMNVVVSNKRLLKDNKNLVFSDKGIATWISLGINNFTLMPGESKPVPFTVTAPAQINYNDAVGALIFSGTPVNSQDNKTQSIGVRQGIELIIPIVVGLPGPIVESLQLLEHKAPVVLLSFMPGNFVYLLNNNGTVYANITGTVEINGLLNKQIIPVEGAVFPEDNYTLTQTWTPVFFDFGIYNAKTTLKYGKYQQIQTIETNDTILVIPVWLIILLLIAFGIWIIRKKEIKSPIKIKIERK